MDKNKKVISNILKELNTRKGFDNWWYNIDDDIKEEIIDTLSHLIPKSFNEEQMIEASRYGYEYRETTSFPEKNFDDNCKNNTKQWLTTIK